MFVVNLACPSDKYSKRPGNYAVKGTMLFSGNKSSIVTSPFRKRFNQIRKVQRNWNWSSFFFLQSLSSWEAVAKRSVQFLNMWQIQRILTTASKTFFLIFVDWLTVAGWISWEWVKDNFLSENCFEKKKFRLALVWFSGNGIRSLCRTTVKYLQFKGFGAMTYRAILGWVCSFD